MPQDSLTTSQQQSAEDRVCILKSVRLPALLVFACRVDMCGQHQEMMQRLSVLEDLLATSQTAEQPGSDWPNFTGGSFVAQAIQMGGLRLLSRGLKVSRLAGQGLVQLQAPRA